MGDLGQGSICKATGMCSANMLEAARALSMARKAWCMVLWWRSIIRRVASISPPGCIIAVVCRGPA